MSKAYLGDGVYVEVNEERGCLVLTTSNGVTTDNTIYLEPEVVTALESFIARLRRRTRRAT